MGMQRHSYRVVYGETRPAWERIFPTLREAKAFAKEHESFGDIIFSIGRVVPGEAPKSLAAALKAADAES
jgi:hypothetical protein